MNARRILEASLALSLVAAGCDSTKNTYYVLDLSMPGSNLVSPTPACSAGAKECIDVDIFRLCHDDGTWGADQLCPDGTLCKKGDCVSPAPSVAPCFPGDTQCAPGTPNVILTCRAAGDGYDVSDCPSGTACDPASLACAGACGAVGSTFCNQSDFSKIDTCEGNVISTKACPSGQLCVTDADGVDGCAPADCDPRSTCAVCGSPTDTSLDPGTIISFCGATPLGYKWQPLTCPAPNGVCDPKAGGACAEGGIGALNANCAPALGAVCTPGQIRCSADFGAVQTCNDKGQWATTLSCDVGKLESCAPSPDQTTLVCADPVCAFDSGACVTVSGVSKIRLCDATGHVSATATDCTAGRCVADGSAVPAALIPGNCVPDCQDGESQCVAGGVTATQTCVKGVWSSATTACQTDGGVGTVECVDTTDPDSGLRHALCAQCVPGSHRCTDAAGDNAVDAGATSTFIQTCGADGTWSGTPVTCAIGVCAGPQGGAACRVQCVPNKMMCLGDVGDSSVAPAPAVFGTAAALPCNADGTLPTAPDCANSPDATGCCQPVDGNATSCRRDSGGNALGCVQCVGSTNNEYGIADTRCTDVSGTLQSAFDNLCGDNDHVAVEVCKSDNTWGPTQCDPSLTCFDPIPPPQRRVCAPCAGGESGTDACTEANLQSLGYSGCDDPLLNGGAGYGSTSVCADQIADCCHSACQVFPGEPAQCSGFCF